MTQTKTFCEHRPPMYILICQELFGVVLNSA